MARKKDSPQKAALRELMGNYLKENNVKVKDGTDVNSIMRDMMSIILEGALDQELDKECVKQVNPKGHTIYAHIVKFITQKSHARVYTDSPTCSHKVSSQSPQYQAQ